MNLTCLWLRSRAHYYIVTGRVNHLNMSYRPQLNRPVPLPRNPHRRQPGWRWYWPEIQNGQSRTNMRTTAASLAAHAQLDLMTAMSAKTISHPINHHRPDNPRHLICPPSTPVHNPFNIVSLSRKCSVPFPFQASAKITDLPPHISKFWFLAPFYRVHPITCFEHSIIIVPS